MTRNDLSVIHVGGPTLLIDLEGVRLLTDPTFDEPGEYRREGASTLVKLTPPAVSTDRLGHLDAVLLSHDEHADNLDDAGRALLGHVPLVLTTPEAAARLTASNDVLPHKVHGLVTWRTAEVAGSDGRAVKVTGVPARHGPPGCETMTGTVTGFVLEAAGLPTVYVSGDNAALELVDEIADRFAPVDVAVIFAGKVSTPLLDGADLTLSSEAAAKAARRLGASTVVGVHTEGWAHFTESPADLRAAFADAGLGDRLLVPDPGRRHEVVSH
ncbi:MBL fold metallo-hydrolase [Nocardioidaceae bacterium SCSIO 66511]|nr:MBL fold metallo-hydrolase [Nocardioidaceae bacterium SCSIO 66511]